MRQRRNVFDGFDGDTSCLQTGDGAFATGPRPLHSNFHFANAELRGPFGACFGSALRRERRTLAAALEADSTGSRPAEYLTVCVGDGDHRIVESGLDVCDGSTDISPNPAPLRFRHVRPPFVAISKFRMPPFDTLTDV